MYILIAIAVLLLIAALIFAFTIWKKTKHAADLKGLVAWVVSKDDNVRYNIPLWAHIKDAQIRCNVPEKYRILWDNERENVEHILFIFQEHLTQSYFLNTISWRRANELTLRIPSSKYTDFFMFRLFCFLSQYHCDSLVWNHKLYAEQISHQSYGIWDKPLYDAVYEFSEFGRTVQKLYYIAFLACKESEIYKGEIAGWLTPEYFTKDLDTNQIRLSRQ